MNTIHFKDGGKLVTYHESLEKANSAALEDLNDPDVLKVSTRSLTTTEMNYRPCPCGSGKKYKFCCKN